MIKGGGCEGNNNGVETLLESLEKRLAFEEIESDPVFLEMQSNARKRLDEVVYDFLKNYDHVGGS